MITFHDITYKNIMSVGNSPIVIQLDKHGKTLITGSNGAGKSTFLEAICFGLFGKPFRKVTKPQLVNSVNKKGLEVVINFKDKKHRYKVTRGIKPNKFEIERDGKLIEEEAATGDYQEYLEKYILKMNITTFKQIVVLGTAGFTPFMLLPASSRRDIIEDLLDISIFSVMLELNKQQSKVIQGNIKDLETTIAKMISEIRIHTQYEKDRRSKSKERIEELTVSLVEVAQKFNACIDEIATLTILMDEATTNLIDSVQGEITKTIGLLSELNAEINQINTTEKFISGADHCNTCKQPIGKDHKIMIKEQSMSKITEIKQKAIGVKGQLDHLTSLQQLREQCVTKINELKSNIKTKTIEKDLVRSAAERIKDEIQSIKMQNETQDKKQEIKSLAVAAQELEDEKRELVSENHCRDVVNGILKDSGVKKLIIRKYIPSINTFINNYLRLLGANYNFVLDEEFNETIKSRGRDNFSYASFSQGERFRIDVAMLFAFRDLVSAKSGSMSNLLVLDEIYDSAADADGVDSMNKILSSLKDNVFIISHNDKHQGFDCHLQMKKVGNFSKMSVSEKEA